MAQRKRIGLLFSYSEEWIAGTYYILNIINALHTLPKPKQPVVVIISEEESNFEIVKKETSYLYLEFIQTPIKAPKYSSFERFINKTASLVGIKKLINKKPLRANIEFLYPFEADVSAHKIKNVNWVPDFQELHLPQLFTKEILAQRKAQQQDVICKGDWVVFSSLDSQNDFNTLYPLAKVQQYVLPFSVTHPSFSGENFSELIKKYKLPEKFYFAPNQFWAHKNHLVILKAVHQLKQKGVDVHIAFSGKENDHRNTDYITLLKDYISTNKLASNCSFLGFIPRSKQLKLMEKALAIVQPSKFEGWSTVVEDAKALNQFIILSDLEVHKEQITKNARFFNPNEPENLAAILGNYWKNPPVIITNEYEKEKIKFAKNFMKLVTATKSI